MSRYGFAPLFIARLAGVPFDVLEALGTPEVNELARTIARREAELDRATDDALAAFKQHVTGDHKHRDKLWKALKKRKELAPETVAQYPFLAAVDERGRALRQTAAALDAAIDREYRRLHGELVRHAANALPDFLVFESDAFGSEVDRLESKLDEPGGHSTDDRRKDRKLALYLQRVCAKNDTVSRFGPHGWGRFVPGDGVTLRPGAIARRRVEIERWVIRGLADAINELPDVREELAPRPHPHARIEGTTATRLDEDRTVTLTERERQLVARCDGTTPAHRLGELDAIASLAERGVLVWALELAARDSTPLATLQSDVESWRPSPTREHWQAQLAALADLARRFGDSESPDERRTIVGATRALIEAVGVAKRTAGRALYAARNPINENCLIDGTFSIGERTGEQLLERASPWIDLYRDASELCARRVFDRMHELVRAAPRANGRLLYSTLTRTAGIADDALGEQIAIETFDAIKREMAELLAIRSDAHVWDLTAADCHFLRGRYGVVPAPIFTYPSADLQAAAPTGGDAEAGKIEWLIAELHHLAVMMQHTQYWSCPDRSALTSAMASIHEGPFLLREAGNAAPVHTNAEPAMSSMPSPVYVGTGRGKRHWHVVRPADAEVVVDESRHDIRLRDTVRGDDLGSLIRTARIMNGMHPFFPFERAPHAPRLRIGGVIVQRETWHVESAALGDARPSGVSAAFVSAVERERAQRGIPRWVFVRPPAGAVATAGWNRDKDNKPLYIDLESVVYLDILERHLRKYGVLVFTEMLPVPSDLFVGSSTGRYSFELRTNIVPR